MSQLRGPHAPHAVHGSPSDAVPVQPSYAPLLLAFGASFLFAGITLHWLFAAAGALITAEALRRWMSEIIAEWTAPPAATAPPPAEHASPTEDLR